MNQMKDDKFFCHLGKRPYMNYKKKKTVYEIEFSFIVLRYTKNIITTTTIDLIQLWLYTIFKRVHFSVQFSSVAQLCLTFCDPHEPQYARPPRPSPTPGVYPNPCPLSRWCHPIISSSSPPSPSPPALSPLLLLPSVFLSIRVFSNEWVLHIRWPKYWSFSFNISPSNEHPGLISFRTDRLDLLAVQGTLKSLLQYHISKASILLC